METETDKQQILHENIVTKLQLMKQNKHQVRKVKNGNKAAGRDNINAELIKYMEIPE